MTRDRIVSAFVELLEQDDLEQISMAMLAKHANVAERTIFRHFPNRADLISAAGEWISTKVFRLVAFDTPDGLAKGFRDACEMFDKNPKLAHAIAITRLGRSARSGFRRRFIESSRKALAPITVGLKPEEKRRAEAVITFLDNVLAWHSMREEFGMSGRDVADAIEWALDALFDDLRRRQDRHG
ncbi:MAG TPA: TetR/AcrR family transcriptional regulator [Rhizobiaceae bacterium]|nr:TetR/AcrR family transcriptional regulator [Rhizobiaceae bacterium]